VLKNKRLLLLIILPLLLILGLSVWVEHSLQKMPAAIPSSWQHWVDPQKSSTLEEVSKLPESAWSQKKTGTANFGYTSDVYWLKVQTPAHPKKWLL